MTDSISYHHCGTVILIGRTSQVFFPTEENEYDMSVKEHKRMLAHTKKLLEYNQGIIAINPRFDKLVTSLRTAVEKGEGTLDKDATSYDNIFDAFRLSLQFYY